MLFSSPAMPRFLVLSLFAALSLPAFAQDRTTEAGEAAITNPNQECAPYDYPPVTSSISAFPPIWSSAAIVNGDSEANALWAKIQPSVPTNIAPKGNRANSQADVTYNGAADPDCWWTDTKCVTPKLAGLPQDVWQVPEPLTMGYGFDDGPNCSHNIFYDFLTSNNQKATMFYIGSNVMDWPLEAQRAVVDGHEVCVHTWSHGYMTSFASPDAFAELYYTMKAIKLVTGVTPTCWRPPYGDVDDRIRAIAHGLNLTTIVWGYDSNDWQFGSNGVTDATVDGYYQSFVNDATNGSFNDVGAIILTHELTNYTMQKAIQWYPKLQQTFKHMVPVGVALNKTQPYVETNYSLPTFQQYASGQTTSNGSAPTTTTSSAASSAPASTSPSASSSSSAGASGASASDKKSGASPTYIMSSLLSSVLAMAFGVTFAL